MNFKSLQQLTCAHHPHADTCHCWWPGGRHSLLAPTLSDLALLLSPSYPSFRHSLCINSPHHFPRCPAPEHADTFKEQEAGHSYHTSITSSLTSVSTTTDPTGAPANTAAGCVLDTKGYSQRIQKVSDSSNELSAWGGWGGHNTPLLQPLSREITRVHWSSAYSLFCVCAFLSGVAGYIPRNVCLQKRLRDYVWSLLGLNNGRNVLMSFARMYACILECIRMMFNLI